MIPDRVPAMQIPITDRSFGPSEIPLDDTMAATEVDSKVKTKLLSMWNNVKYGLYVSSDTVKDVMFTAFLYFKLLLHFKTLYYNNNLILKKDRLDCNINYNHLYISKVIYI